MDISKAKNLLQVCQLVSKMPSGGGWTRSSEIAQWSAVPQATTYRYLPKLVTLGYLEVKKRDYRSGVVISYKITEQGNDYLKSFKELL